MTNIRVLPQPIAVEEPRTPASEPRTELLAQPVALLPAQADEEPIGAALEEIRADLMRHGERLAGLLADPGAAFVRDALRVLEHQICRMAVIGQVKSRQSTFVGALIQQPALLPAEPSPWATAVIRLHFGSAAAPSGLAAEFQLFEDDDWSRLAAGAGRIRELTGQLVPGFEPDLLGRHLDAMRKRAEQRLGDGFEAVLGARHTYETVSRDTLARYVCPGSSAADASDGPGQYSDLTRSADLYFPSGPFKFPASIIATPGINDPFLVRDEITRQLLEPADLYVVVLSARQPLATAELATLRILRELHRERILVFIDHVDELRDPAGEVRSLVAHVRQALVREFPSLDIPVIAGSARWAAQALAPDEAGVRETLTPALLAYARHKGALRPVEVKSSGPAAPVEDLSTVQLARTLAVCSGYPELRRELTGLLLRSHGAHLIRQIAAYFAELSQVNEANVREEMVRLAIASEGGAEDTAEADRELKQVQGELVRIQSVAAELERNLAGLQKLLNETVAEQRTRLYEGLAEILEDYACREGNGLVEALEQGRARRHWRCETTSLRLLVEAELEAARRAVQERLAGCAFNVFPALRETMLRRSPGIELPEAPVPRLGATTVRVPIEDSIALDLATPGSLIGWARSRTPAEHASELERMLIEEFMPAIDEVIRLASAELQREAADLSERSTAISVAVIDALRSQSEAHIARAKVLLDARDMRPREELTQAERLHSLRERVAVAEALSRRLADINTQVGELVS
ncbi:MAG: hypothetical protein KJZ80_08270 [Hyphomicrobiaceae bacterium]|nr:hypothetical protein [Hyphomicrobiaceae bacterium]